MTIILLIAFGGALGSVARYLTTTVFVRAFGATFPYGTLFVNILGSFLIGVLFALLVEKAGLKAEWRAFLMIGVLGGFTTFSSFSLESVALLAQAHFVRAAVYIASSVVLCLAGTALGMAVVRHA
jgi:CrcB protein